MKNVGSRQIYKICECGAFIALSVAISFFEIKIGVLGGSVDFVMIPLFIICYRHGVKYSFLSCFAFSLVYCLIGGKFGYGLPSVLLDYILAYTLCGVAGFFKGKYKFIEIAVLLGCFCRFVIHFISGITLYAITTTTSIAGIKTANAVLFSLIYNGIYMLPNTILAIVVMAVLRPALKRLDNFNK